MPRTFTISASFLAGRYHGREWPPSPARLMQALVAAAKGGQPRRQWGSISEGLRWLEQQPPPIIRACKETDLKTYRLAVPNNDLDSPARDWLAGRWNDGTSIRTMKKVQPRLLDATCPHVEYEWEIADNAETLKLAEQLRPAIHALHTLGWGIDMAFADASFNTGSRERLGWTQYVPGTKGEIYDVLAPGTLDDLESTFERYTKRSTSLGVDTNTRPSVYREQRYQEVGRAYPPFATFILLRPDEEEIFSLPWSFAMDISAWMRHSAGELLSPVLSTKLVKSEVYGHSDADEDANDRISYVPLPSIHPQHGDGRIRRVMITEFRASEGELIRTLQAKWRGKALKHEEVEKCVLKEQSDSVTKFYTGTSTVWASVTPVILHGYNANRGVISINKTESLLLRAFEMAGFGKELIDSLSFQPSPFWRGAETARRIRIPKHLANFPRYHVRLKFREKVDGPVLAGIGRHYGIGLFATQ